MKPASNETSSEALVGFFQTLGDLEFFILFEFHGFAHAGCDAKCFGEVGLVRRGEQLFNGQTR